MNLLLVNLTRFGDLLQTQPVVHGLRAQGHRVGLVCLENFAGAAALLEGVDHVAALPGSALLAGVQPGGDWRACTAGLMTWADRLRGAYAHDAVLNLTATLGGRLLGRLLAANGSDAGDGELRASGWTRSGSGSMRTRGRRFCRHPPGSADAAPSIWWTCSAWRRAWAG